MLKKFQSAASLSAFLQSEKDVALDYLCSELECDRESVAFIFEGSEVEPEALEIPHQ